MIDYQLRTRLVAGERAIEKLGTLAKQLGARRVLIVSDPGVVGAGIYKLGAQQISDSGLEVLGFHNLAENPSTDHVQAGLQVAQDYKPDLLVGLGGGSSMDCAKGINFLYSCGGKMSDYWGVGKATAPMLPMIAIPTTAGTGSETQSFALISDAHTHVKMACGDPKASPAIAILDPVLTCSQPASVTALTGIDALTHSLESFVTTKRNAMSDCYAREAWMLGAAHALANPLTAYLGVPHGQAVGMMMPHVIRFNATCVESRYRELVHLLPEVSVSDRRPASEILADRFTRWLRIASMATALCELPGWTAKFAESQGSCAAEELLESMALMAEKQWTGGFNPRPVRADDFLAIYRAASTLETSNS
jgi:alcohol dehydrogenase